MSVTVEAQQALWVGVTGSHQTGCLTVAIT